MTFQEDILAGIPDILPEPRPYDTTVSHAPRRKDILSPEEKRLAAGARQEKLNAMMDQINGRFGSGTVKKGK